MIRGFLSGALFAIVLAGLGLGAASYFGPRVELGSVAPAAGDVEVPAGSEFNAERPDTAPVLPATEGRPAGAAPTLAGAETTTDAPAVDTAPAATPNTANVDGSIAAPESGTTAVQPGADSTVSTTTAVTAPAQPGLEAAPNAETAVVPTDPPATDTAQITTPEASAAPTAPTGEIAPNQAVTVETPATPAPEATAVVEGPAETPATSEGTSAIAAPALDVDAPSAPSTVGDGPSLPSLAGIGDNLGEDALPRIGASPEAPATEALDPAIERFATAFAPSGDKPRLAIVLLDDTALAIDKIADFSVPLAVAVDPLAPAVGARMAELRAAGIEVLALAPLPQGASPADVEVSFQAFLSAVPQAVGVMDFPEAGLQESRSRAVQVVDILKANGLGLLTYNKGLNAALQIADQEDLAAAKVARVFDDGTAEANSMKIALDKGAFQSGQDGAAILVGTLREDVLDVLKEWATGNRAGTVELAPVSFVLMGK